MPTKIVVLAAGLGKRMNSALPKVLHTIAGKKMLSRVLDAATPLTDHEPIVVHGHNGDILKSHMGGRQIDWVLQSEQLGTGHAVLQALPLLQDSDLVLILCADIPLIKTETLRRLLDKAEERQGFSILTVKMDEPQGYGRIFRNENGSVKKIVETIDLDRDDVDVKECNSGIFAMNANYLKRWLPRLKAKNRQKEFYLTDCVSFANSENLEVSSVEISTPVEAMGVNDKKQLAQAERAFQSQVADDLLDSGVTLMDPSRLDVRGELDCGQDVTIDINVVFEGQVILGNGVYIGANSILKNSSIADNSAIKENCVLDSVLVGSDCEVGPFSRLRPDTKLLQGATVGNFVEIKNTVVGEDSKVNHLSYLGDSDVGRGVNIGAGSITCNYDGANKNKTIIKDGVFVGSNTELVAPLVIGSGATIGAGSTITKDVEDDALVVSRVSQKSIEGWRRPSKKK